MAQGWIKIHRQILENSFCNEDSERLGFWVTILLLANHEEKEVFINTKKIIVKPGQLITGRKSLAQKCGVSEMKCERWLSCLENEQQIAQQKTTKFRLITVKKWKQYQDTGQQNAQQMHNKRTTDEQQMNTNKNDKNVKNDKKYIYTKKNQKNSQNIRDGDTIKLYDGTIAIRRFGEWVDSETHTKLNRTYYKELP